MKIMDYIIQHYYDHEFTSNKMKYVMQCLLASLIMMFTLLFLNAFSNAVVIASIGATAFIVFSMPHRENSRDRYILGAYAIGIMMGSLCYMISQVHVLNHYVLFTTYGEEIFGGLAVGFTMFVMLITDLEHPPAAGLALGLVLREWSVRTLVITALAIFQITLFRRLLKKYLIDLI